MDIEIGVGHNTCNGVLCKWFEQVCEPCVVCHEWLLKSGVPHKYTLRRGGELIPPHIRDEEGAGEERSSEGGGDGEPPIPAHESVYELTLTSTEDDPYYLRMTLERIEKSAMFEIVHYEACIELTKAGLPHLHAILYSKRKTLDASKLKKMFKYRAELKKVRNEIAFINYIKKEDGNPIVYDYCSKKGIPQIWKKC